MKTKSEIIREFAEANGIKIIELKLADVDSTTVLPSLSEDLRENIIDYLVKVSRENVSHRDHYYMFRYGIMGFEENSDQELVDTLSMYANEADEDNLAFTMYREASAQLAIDEMLIEDVGV